MSETLTALAGAPSLAFVVSLAVAFFLSRGKAARLALDRPNERSLHVTPVPRTGGIAVLTAAGVASMVFGPAAPAALIGALAVVAAVSLIDDIRHIPAGLRLAVHIGAAGFFVHSVATPDIPLAAQAVLAVAIAWLCNLYNFMDGSDGLAGGMALIGFGIYGAAAAAAGDLTFARTNLIVAAAAAGFLALNFYPARIFLGDVGSVPLGFLAGTLGVLGWSKGIWPLWFPAVVFSAFIVDASVTLARRVSRRERFWIPHRDHYYQRLVQIGWGHARTAWAEYALMATTGALALLALALPKWACAALLLALACGYALLALAVEHAWRGRLMSREP
ncbi:MAG TPA: glycosyltransferase family 4 protein [Burkholderiales bacterium]|nr:glycosyltransferase family 4 protein [Burkholderiales bacterium]